MTDKWIGPRVLCGDELSRVPRRDAVPAVSTVFFSNSR